MTSHRTNAAHGSHGRSTVLSTVLFLTNLVMLALALGALWPVRYTLDLLANLAWHLLLLAAIMLLVSVVLRRFAVATPAFMACLMLGGLLIAQPRAERAPKINDNHAETIRLLVFNMTVSNRDTDGVLELFHRAEPDVIVLVETSPALRSMIFDDDEALEAFPHRVLPRRPSHAPTAILSRWPLEAISPFVEEDRDHQRRVRAAKVEHPNTPFVLLSVHPISPRNPTRWHSGNLTIQRSIAQVRQLQYSQPHPVLVAGDFNATPTGRRSRLLSRETGLRRAQPLWRFHGTWPSHLPGWLRLPIDDVYVPAKVRVLEWSLLDAAGSEHYAILIELQLPGSHVSG